MTPRARIEFGDFQTPRSLADQVLSLLVSRGIKPTAIVEPTCGKGSFVQSAMEVFDCPLWAFEINASYLDELRPTVAKRVTICQQDFFERDWRAFFASLPDNVLILGNPPWATNATLGAMKSTNLPEKSNFQSRGGLAAKTGKANFDISEWMLIKLAEAIGQRSATIAMLCKTSTARKFLRHAWNTGKGVSSVSLHAINAAEHFGAAVDACLLICHLNRGAIQQTADIFNSLTQRETTQTLGFVGRELVANVAEYARLSDLEGIAYYRWRSGAKHDASRVMEFERNESGKYVNGFGEAVDLEDECVHPLLKSSDLGNGRLQPRKYVMLTQRQMGEDTKALRESAPKTWAYLLAHAAYLDARGSSIYRESARFAVFGVGPYTFAPWKVAISGLYKSLRFSVVGPFDGKPIVFDDTCYFAACDTRKEAEFLAELLQSELAKRFFSSLVFLDSKRPLTTDILHRLDIKRVAERLGREAEFRKILKSADRLVAQTHLVYERPKKVTPETLVRRARA